MRNRLLSLFRIAVLWMTKFLERELASVKRNRSTKRTKATRAIDSVLRSKPLISVNKRIPWMHA